MVTPNASASLTITTEDTLSAGQYTTTITATPEQGLEKTTNFVINVAPRPDDPPIINVSTSQITLNATSPSGAPVTYGRIPVTDDVDGTATLEGDDTRTITQDDIGGDITISCNPPSGSIFPIGNTNVTCTAADSTNKTVSESFLVTVVESVPQTPTTTITNTTSPQRPSNTPPEISAPSTPVEVQATNDTGAQVSYQVTASDREDGNIVPQCDPPSGSIFRVGETTVRCSTRDTAGNIESTEFPVIVRPSEPPILFIIIPLIAGIAAAAVIIILIWRRKRSKSTTDIDEGTRVY